MLSIAMTTATRIDLIVLIAVLLWLLLAAATATPLISIGTRSVDGAQEPGLATLPAA